MAHIKWMQHALQLANLAQDIGEVPVGACVVLDENIIGEGYNRCIIDSNPCAHAEILALQQAGKNSENYRLTEATLYTTLEPCTMCAGAIVHARIKCLVFGAYDTKTGVISSCDQLLDKAYINHSVEIVPQILATECSHLLSHFFAATRKDKKPEYK